MTPDDAKNLKALLKTMQERDTNFQVSGASHHQYRLRPVLTEDELRAFEQKHQITLPPDYRFFLKEIGNGGAGPSYGIPTLENALCDCDPSQSFPFTEQTEAADFPGVERWGDDEPYPGLVVIRDNGTFFSYLVVNGPARGSIWETDYGFNFYPTGLLFDAWYREWSDFLIEVALPTLDREKAVDQVKIGMTQTDVIALCGAAGGPWKKKKSAWSKWQTLRFECLASCFEIDEKATVVRICRLHIFKRTT